jgi:hypothetical protein
MEGLLLFLRTINDVITAGVAIISFSLFIYVVTFNLHDSVTRSFAFLLACIVIIFGSDAFVTTTFLQDELLFILRIQYIGLIFLPTAYFLFSDALLTTTGKPSKGKRRLSGYISICISSIFFILLMMGDLFSKVIVSIPPVPFIERTLFQDYFIIFFIIMMLFSWYNFIRSLNRTSTKKSNRRMVYLITSAVGPALGSFPYLLFGSSFASNNAAFFWLLSILAYVFVAISIFSMTYTVSFFGFPWPDRVIKSRLFRWIMRGPITASLTLGVTTIITRIGKLNKVDVSSLIVLGMVATIVLFEFLITIFAPIWERLFFNGSEREELEKIRILEDRLLTKNDLEQFLELILSSLCDRLQIRRAGLIEDREDKSTLQVNVGDPIVKSNDEKKEIINYVKSKKEINVLEIFNENIIIPILNEDLLPGKNLLGIIIVEMFIIDHLDEEKKSAIEKLTDRAASALKDRNSQELLFGSLEILTPQVTEIQTILALSRFNQKRILNGFEISNLKELEKWVKNALTHFFGGPRLSQNPLLQLTCVQYRILEKGETPITALREILREEINRLRPVGERQYTNEWIIFNILELKFIEGWKVKDLARRLSLSEADFYRKQRIAVSAIAEQILTTETKKADLKND